MPLTTEDLSQIKGIVNEVISEVVPGVVNEVVHGIVQEAVAPLATKEELYETKQEIMDELAKKADKADLERVESRMMTAMGLLERDTFDRFDRQDELIRSMWLPAKRTS